MRFPWSRSRRSDVPANSAVVDRDAELRRAQQELELTKSQTPVHRALVSAAAREVFEVNHLAQTFRATLRRGQA